MLTYRYKNIWPYDFSRVRLNSPASCDGDYINASFVQPRGTPRRYIATQGPLDSTYRDFWTLVWEQQVSVIVMLTRQYEGGTLKCGNYWEEEAYGPIRLRLVSKTEGEDKKPDLSNVSGFDFGAASGSSREDVPQNIKRTFSLSREDREEPPRTVVQIQCCAWPDFDVPDSPRVLLDLLKDVDAATSQTQKQEANELSEHRPVLVHCECGLPIDLLTDTNVRLRRCRSDRFLYHGRRSSRRAQAREGSTVSRSDTTIFDRVKCTITAVVTDNESTRLERSCE